ncbi:lipase family protein [Croceibacterium mercuriale]|uniref:hypothetical protein n=1 Tax=Croceibacterium mercuriale TaxID=1572751 RepID=UPI000B194BAA|nr:hypothetical protein [Croceibacterium mercuriale]
MFRKIMNLSLALAAIGLAGTTLTSAAQAQQTSAATPDGVKNVVLVHGAFADGSGWRAVYDDLTSRGYRVTLSRTR